MTCAYMTPSECRVLLVFGLVGQVLLATLIYYCEVVAPETPAERCHAPR